MGTEITSSSGVKSGYAANEKTHPAALLAVSSGSSVQRRICTDWVMSKCGLIEGSTGNVYAEMYSPWRADCRTASRAEPGPVVTIAIMKGISMKL